MIYAFTYYKLATNNYYQKGRITMMDETMRSLEKLVECIIMRKYGYNPLDFYYYDTIPRSDVCEPRTSDVLAQNGNDSNCFESLVQS